MFEKKLEIAVMMEEEMNKKMMECREGLDFDIFSKFGPSSGKNHKEKEKEKNE